MDGLQDRWCQFTATKQEGQEGRQGKNKNLIKLEKMTPLLELSQKCIAIKPSP
jgi:hypothetical protein